MTGRTTEVETKCKKSVERKRERVWDIYIYRLKRAEIACSRHHLSSSSNISILTLILQAGVLLSVLEEGAWQPSLCRTDDRAGAGAAGVGAGGEGGVRHEKQGKRSSTSSHWGRQPQRLQPEQLDEARGDWRETGSC